MYLPILLMFLWLMINTVGGGDFILPQNSGERPMTTRESKARAALIHYIKDVVLNKENPAGDAIRAAVLDDRSPQERLVAEQEILAQAEAFPDIANKVNQKQPWQLLESKDNTKPCLYYSGQILGLATEIEFELAGEEVARVYIEVD